ncbi:MAG: DUF4932 domain-containing protein [Cyclobacteriaceae bacterium]
MKLDKAISGIIMGLLISLSVEAQNLESEMLFPDTLRSAQDTFYINSPKFSNIWSHPISKEDTLNLGTSGYNGVYMTIWTDLDTINIPHVNFPYRQLVKIPITSKTDTALCILRFQASNSNFSDQYVNDHKGQISFEIPEVYELANVILYLSSCSDSTRNHPNTEYTKRLEKHFSQFRDHKLIEVLNNNCASGNFWSMYYGFRENSICFELNRNELNYTTRYKNVFWDESGIFGGQFRNLLYLVQDFVNSSDFREFYKQNADYYEDLETRQSELLPVGQMWEWLENEFPQRMDSYRIIFSSLIEGSHSTQKFYKGFFGEPEFQENIMFINSPESIDMNDGYSETLKEGLMSGIVFTEIDHNYVNPASDERINEIKSLIDDKDFWATKEVQENYRSEYAIFNEYMTHSLFCLYVMEVYDKDLSAQIIEKRINLMNRRGFMKFREFNNILTNLKMNENESVYESYSMLIESMNLIKKGK